MTTDLDWRELIDQSFGDGPDQPPIGNRLAAGRRAVRRRRIVGGRAWRREQPGLDGIDETMPDSTTVVADRSELFEARHRRRQRQASGRVGSPRCGRRSPTAGADPTAESTSREC